MPVGSGPAVFDAITVRRAEVLREIADGRTLREVAAALGIERSGVRSHVERLKLLTGCENTRELGRWWREHRQEWLVHMADAAGAGHKRTPARRSPRDAGWSASQ
jgi:DNA-binding CsgD family transcriptional regulator